MRVEKIKVKCKNCGKIYYLEFSQLFMGFLLDKRICPKCGKIDYERIRKLKRKGGERRWKGKDA